MVCFNSNAITSRLLIIMVSIKGSRKGIELTNYYHRLTVPALIKEMMVISEL